MEQKTPRPDIADARTALRLSQEELAAKIDVQRGTITRAETGDKPVSKKLAKALSPILGMSEQQLLFGPDSEVQPDQPYSEPVGGNVPEFDVDAQGGLGGYRGEIAATDDFGNGITREGKTAAWLIPDEYLQGGLRTKSGRATIVECTGDSMSPLINSGDKVIIDHGVEKLRPDTIYLIDYGFGPAIKRVVPLPNTDPAECLIVSENTSVQDHRITLEMVHFIGRVCGRIHRM